MSTSQQFFIAVQCFQCSTMQVKQQKKSSNKWVCVVCNQKQSVRRLYARGPLARDVRGFVQRFNMSRMSASGSDSGAPVPIGSEAGECRADSGGSHPPLSPSSGGGVRRRPRRTDWSEFMDPEEEGAKEEDGVVGDEEPFLKCPPRARTAEGNKAFIQPFFSKRKQKPHTQEGVEQKKRRGVTMEGSSKWIEYLEGEADDILEEERGSPNPFGSWCDKSQSQFHDVRVEEEIHPDF